MNVLLGTNAMKMQHVQIRLARTHVYVMMDFLVMVIMVTASIMEAVATMAGK